MLTTQELECMKVFFARNITALIPRSTWRSLETSQGAKLDRLYKPLTKPQQKDLLKCRQSKFWKDHHLDMYLRYTARRVAEIRHRPKTRRYSCYPHLINDDDTRNYNKRQLYEHKKSHNEIMKKLPSGTAHTIENLIVHDWLLELGDLVVAKQDVARKAKKLARRLAKRTGNPQTGFRMRKSRKRSRKRKASRKTSRKRKASRKRSRKRRSAKRKTSRKRRSAKRKTSRKTSRKRRSSKRKASRKRSRKRRSSKRCPAGCVKKKTSKRKSRKVKKKLKFKLEYSGPRTPPSLRIQKK